MSILEKYLLLIFIIQIALEEIKAANLYIISTRIYFNPTYVQELRVDINPGNMSVNVTYNIAQDQTHDPYAYLAVDRKNRRTNKYRNMYRSSSLNICKMKKSLNIFTLESWIVEFMKVNEVNTAQCPFKKGNYTWFNISANTVRLPSFVSGSYRGFIEIKFKMDKELETQFNLTVNWEIK